MKKLNYIIAFTMVGLIGFQPVKQNITNYLSEQNRLTQEAFINDFLSKRQTVSYKDSKKLPKALRPDLKGAHDYLMMYDPNTGTIPTERILDAVEFAEQKRMSLSYEKRMTEVNWVERGPNTIGGRTRAILLDPNDSTNKKLWAAGVTGGLWYTNDITAASPTWNSVDGTWGNLAVGSINSDPNNSNTMYVGTGERMGIFSTSSRGLGMWKTTDGGATWSHLTATENFNYVTDIVVRNESGTSVVYAGVGGHFYEGQWHGSANTGLWRSADGGATWTQVMDTTSDGTNYEIMDLDMGSDNRLWAGSRTNVYGDGGGDIFYSDDGTNWTKASLGFIGSANRTIVAVAPSDPNTVYGMIASSDTRKINWIVKTTDSGANWTVYTYGTSDPFPVDSNGNVLGDANGQAGYDLSLGVDPNDPNTVFAGELDIFKTTDAGASWTQVTGGGSGTASMHVDQQNLKTITSNEIIFSNDGGIYYTSDAGVTVSNRNTGYNVSQFYSVALHPDAGSQYVMGGTQDNGTWTIQGTGIQSGSAKVGGDGAYTHIDQLDPNYQFTATTYNSIYRSTNGGSSFSLYANHEAADGSDTGFFINPSTIDPTSQTFYSAVDASTILRLNNYSTLADKTLMSISLGSTASAFKMSPHTDGVLFVGTSSGRVFKITDAHTSSYTATDISGSNVSGYIASIDIGKDDNQILVTVSNYGSTSVWETVGGGGANGWIDVEGDLADMPIRWGLYNPNNYNQVILATELGTWVSDDISVSSPTWNPSNDGLANVRTDMLVRRSSDNALAAGTHGRGLFYSTGFTSTAPLNAAYSSDKTSGTVPVEVTFKDRSTGNPTSWAWDFGDGSTSTDPSPVYTYNTAGTYSVTLSVSDGNASDSEVKNNSIFVTSVQDTLWADGFESCFESYPRNGRDNYRWLWRDANGDDDGPGCYPESLNAGFELAYDEDKGMGFGNGADAGTVWDDWLISPEVWLRGGVDNLAKFYANGFNSTYPESFDVMLSPSGGSAVSDFTVTLASIVDDGEAWNEYTYDLTQWAGSKVRIAIHHKSSAQYYEFYDLFMITAGQLSADNAPAAPTGIVVEPKLDYEDTDGDGTVSSGDTWTPSDNAVSVFWNRNGEPDLASYNVYASTVDGFTASSSNLIGQGTQGVVNVNIPVLDANDTTDQTILNADYYNMRTFGADYINHDNLTQGETWYYKVSAVDTDGNETLSNQQVYTLDTSGPTTGTVTISDIYDSSYIRSTTQVTITTDGWSDNTGIDHYTMGIGTTNTDTSADVVGYQNVGTSNLSLSELSLDDYTSYYLKVYAVDINNNTSSLVNTGFSTYANLLGDYDADWDVDVEDLNSFVNAWPSVDLGPATGTSPYLTPSLDGSADINDVSVFTRNWQWTKAQGKTSESEQQQKLNPINFPAELFGNQIKITLPDNITAGRFEIINEGNVYQFSVAKNNQSMIILENNDSLEETYEFEFGRLSQDEKELFIYIDGDTPRSEIEVSYQLFSKDGAAGNGVMELGNPDEFKLYQNYPNPFNNQTTFQYDVAEVTSVKIYIYNTLGQLVKTIDRGENSVGTHTVEWDGKNDDGDTLSSGVYFYQLRTKDFNKTMKMLLVK